MNRYTILILAGICGIWCGQAGAAEKPPERGVASPFDKQDPEIQKLKALDWKGVDFDAQDQKTRCVALLALNAVLTRIGGKADARLDLLLDYLEEQKLGEEFAGQMTDGPEQQPVSFDDARKIAVAFLKTPMGTGKFGDDLEGCDDNTLKAYQKLYDKTARASYEQTVASRLQVAAMGTFLQKKGKFEEFTKWAEAERKKRQEAYEKEVKEKQEKYVQNVQVEKEKRASEYAEYQAKRRAADDAAASQMAAGMEYQEQGGGGGGGDQPQWYGDAYWGWNGAYYASNAYRGAVADRARNAYGNWNGGRVRAARGGGRR